MGGVSGDAAFARLHRNLLVLEKILPAQDPDVAEHEQPIVQRLQAGAALGPRPSCPNLSPPFVIGPRRG